MRSEGDLETILNELEGIASRAKAADLPLQDRVVEVERAREILRAFLGRYGDERFEVLTTGGEPYDWAAQAEGSR